MINYPRTGSLNAQTGWAEDRHTILCACVKRTALKSGDEELMRPMITRFPDVLHANLTLNGTVAHITEVRYEYGLIDVLSTPEEQFFGVLFEVDVIVKDCPITVEA